MQKTLNASILFYAIILSMVIASTILLFLLYAQSHLSYGQMLQNQVAAYKASESGIAFLQAHSEAKLEETVLSLNGGERIWVEKKIWGMYELGWSKSEVKKKSAFAAVLLGKNFSSKQTPTLYLQDLSKALTLTGNTSIQGKIKIPLAGIQYGNLQGEAFSGTVIPSENTSYSRRVLPPLDTVFLQHNHQYLQGNIPATDSLVPFSEWKKSAWSFEKTSVVLWSEEPIVLDGDSLRGNIMVWSEQEILIKNNCQLQGLCLYAPKIELEEKTKAQVQLFAQDSLVLGAACRLDYPSVAALIREGIAESTAYLSLGKESQLKGLVLLNDLENDIENTKVFLGENAKIEGMVYNTGTTEMTSGKVNGSVYTGRFYLQNGGQRYVNYLHQAELKQSLPAAYLQACLFKKNHSKEILQYLD